ncbi:MAG: glycosyltransferase [Bacteroidota bacterium]|nr:glycosyltransferase [Bacteroidota bacterium]
MKFLFTGKYNSKYNRNRIVLKGLKQIGHEVIEFPFSKKTNEIKHKLKKLSSEVDYIFLPNFSHKYVSFVKKNTDKALIFDPLVSKYMTNVFDFKRYPKFSYGALKHFNRDKKSFKLADILLADTYEHKKYFINTFKIPEDKVKILPIGIDSEIFFPLENERKDNDFVVGYVGGYIPLHGMHHIIEAIRIIENRDEKNIKFHFIGTGHDFEKSKRLIKKYNLKSIKITNWVEEEKLNEYIKDFNICLGIFGDSIKTDVVIPNKIYEYSATKKCTISKHTKAMQEIFTNNKDIVLSDNNAESIANKIIELKNNPLKIQEIAENTYQLIIQNYSEKHIAKMLIEKLK